MVFAFGAQASAEWPEKPITVVCSTGAGGGTDTLTRAWAKEMSKYLGVTINVINRPGALSSLAMEFVQSKPANGYWILASPNFGKGTRLYGYTKQDPIKDWQYYKCANSLEAWSVKPDSPFKTFADMLDGFRKNPGKYKLSTGEAGTIWDQGNKLLQKETGVDFGRIIPYKSGARVALATLQGEIDVAVSGLHEHIEFIRAGKLRNLAVFVKEPMKLKDGITLRPVTDFVPGMAKYAPFGGDYDLGVRRDTPVEILVKIKEAFIAAANSPSFEQLLDKRFFQKNIAIGEDADQLAVLRDSVASWLLWDVKAQGAKVNPADFGLPRPEDFDAWWPPKGYKSLLSNQ